ncbi:type V toxin-antitoxin system endoribonuclease antitoxin GhoS [Atlantibacter sp.]|uniref:type V toxin-antitoxin system endoribonuclease antitoxin GhoS n=1 Tax=Atlantibacter sp. TaxID=1903473 RepID=UPI0013EFB472|nr:type V toxin-antitoxin system endoribonuclease antitoxin GhoS [Atlantibacter sp.]
MASGEIKRYVVTFHFQEENLTDINELNNNLTRSGFTLTMSDDDGKVHELGINTFGLITAQDEQDVRALAEGLGEAALGQKPEVEITTWEAWLADDS